MLRILCAVVLGVVGLSSSIVTADLVQSIEDHPAASLLKDVLSRGGSVKDFSASGLTRADYLSLIAGNIDFFKSCQVDSGAIIDPATHKEQQYSTPAFAFASALLVREAKRDDLKDASIKAFDWSLTCLVEKRAADGHSDFYIPMLMHAHRLLKDIATPEQSVKWAKQLRSINPPKIYRTDLAKMNWNIVSTSGECLRRKDGFVDEKLKDAQRQYIEKCYKGHEPTLTKFGLYDDPGAPLAYDAFSRLWLEDVMHNDAYDGAMAKTFQSFLDKGGLTTLLLISPIGEWPSGGRSAFHNWNEAEIAAICEYNACRWAKAERADIAGAFKHGARLSLASMKRWQRPSGELNIIKNHAEPEQRFAYERYSNHSQYNLLPMAMLSMAYLAADESIAEKPIPSEIGGYVFDLRETFHKVVAAAGGYYALIDTVGDPHYNATGLQRVHRIGVTYSPLSDTASVERDYGAKDEPKIAIVSSLQWKSDKGDWIGLGDFLPADKKRKEMVLGEAKLGSVESSPDQVSFTIEYPVTEKADVSRQVVETYTVDSTGVTQSQQLRFAAPSTRLLFPALVTDGKTETKVSTAPGEATISHNGGTLKIKILSPEGLSLTQTGPRVPCHLGYLQMLVAETKEPAARWQFTLEK